MIKNDITLNNTTIKKDNTTFIGGPKSTIHESSHYKTSSSKSFRGPIPNSYYYIINEIISGENNKVFSAVKMTSSGNIDETRYSVKYFSKKWIKEEVLHKLKFPEERIIKFFESIKKSLNDFKQIKNEYIQTLYDYYDDDDGMYIILEFCDWTLRDYISMIREPLRNSRAPFEYKIRKFILHMLHAIYHLHEHNSLSFGGLLNSSDIMVAEPNDNSGSTIVKFPHPFLANLMTILKIYDNENFPSHYSPEVYELFQEDVVLKIIEKKDSFDMGSLLSKINQNFDMWALGYCLYEILFDNPPFAFDNLKKVLSTLTKDFAYKINPYGISFNSLKIINLCLQYEPQERLQSFLLNEIIEEFKKENDAGEEFENSLKERGLIKGNLQKDDLEKFQLTQIYFDKYQ